MELPSLMEDRKSTVNCDCITLKEGTMAEGVLEPIAS